MLELLLCSLVTIFPDYLFRRYAQGKRIGWEITFYSVWYELRWGITACVFLTLSLITMIFYFHPSTSNTTAIFRTVTVLPERSGRVDEVFVGVNQVVEQGQPLFRLDSAEQEAAAESARRRVAEIDAEIRVAGTELAAADGKIRAAEGAYRQVSDELRTKSDLLSRNSNTVSVREVERLQVALDGQQGVLDAALAEKATLDIRISTLLPAQKASAEAALAEAQVELNKTVVRAGVAGTLHQFTLRPGDVVNPMLRPAGILVPTGAGRERLVAGFGQIEAQVLKVGMIGEVTCISKPFTIIPMVVTEVQDAIAAGQIRPTDQLIDLQQRVQPGSITVFLEPLYAGQLDGVPPGGSCITNVYTNSHDELASGHLGAGRWLFLHAVDAVGIVHAMILRLQALLLPVQTLVLGGH